MHRKNNFTLNNKWWCTTSRIDQAMRKHPTERNKSELKWDWNGSAGICQFAHLHSATNDCEVWIIAPFQINFLPLKVELPEGKLWGLRPTCFPVRFSERAGNLLPSPQCWAHHAVMHRRKAWSCQTARPRFRSMQTRETSSSGRVDAQDF